MIVHAVGSCGQPDIITECGLSLSPAWTLGQLGIFDADQGSNGAFRFTFLSTKVTCPECIAVMPKADLRTAEEIDASILKNLKELAGSRDWGEVLDEWEGPE